MPFASVSPNAIAMTHMCGSFTSLAKGKWNGGIQSKANPVPRNESLFQRSPPMNLSASQTTRSTTRTVKKPITGRMRRRQAPSGAVGAARSPAIRPGRASARPRLPDRLVGDLEGGVDDLEALASCSSVMHSGGLVWIELLAIIVYRPFSRKYLAIAFISSDVPLNGVSGVHGSWLRTRSMIPNSPRLRVAPTLGWLAASRSWWPRRTASSRAALPMRSSSS